MRSERGAVGSFILDPVSALFAANRILKFPEGVIQARLITLLPHRSVDYESDQSAVEFKGVGEMAHPLEGHRARQQHFTERLVTAANISITKPMNEIAAADTKCP